MRPLLFVIEGPDGVGKTMQAKMLIERLELEGHSVWEYSGNEMYAAIECGYPAAAMGRIRDPNVHVDTRLSLVAEMRSWIVREMEESKAEIAIIDRWTLSTWIYGAVVAGASSNGVMRVVCDSPPANRMAILLPPYETVADRGVDVEFSRADVVRVWDAYYSSGCGGSVFCSGTVNMIQTCEIEMVHENIYTFCKEMLEFPEVT